jgi:thymidylate synthase
MNKLDTDYQNLVTDILINGIVKNTRNGKVLSTFGHQIRHKMRDGFPLLTTKKMAFKTMVVELLWFLKGRTDLRYLLENDCHIWDGDAYMNYLKYTITAVENGFDKIKGYLDNCLVEFEGSYEHFTNPSFAYGFRPHTQEEFINKIKTDDGFAKKFGSLGKIYGAQWRDWNGRQTDGFIEYENNGYNEHIKGIDQIQNLINDLKTNPDSRRLMVNAWNVSELPNMVLPPCHYGFQVWTRELSLEERFQLAKYQWPPKGLPNVGIHNLDERGIPKRAISLSWNQRSVDVGLGLPFNIASYGLLLHLIANEVNMVPDELIGNLGDTHIYFDHVEGLKEQLDRESFKLSYVSFLDEYHYLNDKELVGDLSFDRKIKEFRPDMFIIKDYTSHPKIVLPLSN